MVTPLSGTIQVNVVYTPGGGPPGGPPGGGPGGGLPYPFPNAIPGRSSRGGGTATVMTTQLKKIVGLLHMGHVCFGFLGIQKLHQVR